MSKIKNIFQLFHAHIVGYEHIVYPVFLLLFLFLIIVILSFFIKNSRKNATINHLILTNNANDELTDIEGKVNKLKVRFEAYLLRYEEIKTTISVIKNSLNSNIEDWKETEKILSLKSEITSQISKKEELENALETLNGYAQKVIDKLKINDTELNEKQNSKNTLNSEIESLNIRKQELVDALELLNNYGKRIISNIKIKDTEMHNLTDTYQNLQAQYQIMTLRVKDLETEIAKKQQGLI